MGVKRWLGLASSLVAATVLCGCQNGGSGAMGRNPSSSGPGLANQGGLGNGLNGGPSGMNNNWNLRPGSQPLNAGSPSFPAANPVVPPPHPFGNGTTTSGMRPTSGAGMNPHMMPAGGLPMHNPYPGMNPNPAPGFGNPPPVHFPNDYPGLGSGAPNSRMTLPPSNPVNHNPATGSFGSSLPAAPPPLNGLR